MYFLLRRLLEFQCWWYSVRQLGQRTAGVGGQRQDKKRTTLGHRVLPTAAKDRGQRVFFPKIEPQRTLCLTPKIEPKIEPQMFTLLERCPKMPILTSEADLPTS